jgi:uncharacterized protein YfaS (alpha-2-macroglobulin family)
MSETFPLKVGDTAPVLQATLSDNSGTAVDLTGAEVQFRLLEPRGKTVKLSASATIHDAPNGVVRYSWGTDDTDEAGRYRAEFEVTYADDSVETFPNDGYHDVVLTP